MPPVQFLRPVIECVSEPSEGASAVDGGGETVCLAGVPDTTNEEFHVAIRLDRAKALDPQPTLRGFGLALVFVAHLHGVVDRRLGPHLAGPSVDTSAAVHRVALENVRELLEIHGQWRQRQSRSCADGALEMIGKELVAVPATLTQRRSADAASLAPSTR